MFLAISASVNLFSVAAMLVRLKMVAPMLLVPMARIAAPGTGSSASTCGRCVDSICSMVKPALA
jgi:hypothetical protein